MNKKVLCLDPAGGAFGVVVLQVVDGTITIPMHFLLTAPDVWDISRKNSYMAHCVAAIVALEKPDVVVSEKPWGMGFSKDSLLQLIGAIKAETWSHIEWQGVSQARKGVIGDGHGGSDKIVSAEHLLNYPFGISAKRFIKNELDLASKGGKIGYDILDAIMHGVYYLVDNGLTAPVHKPAKKVRKKKDIISES